MAHFCSVCRRFPVNYEGRLLRYTTNLPECPLCVFLAALEPDYISSASDAGYTFFFKKHTGCLNNAVLLNIQGGSYGTERSFAVFGSDHQNDLTKPNYDLIKSWLAYCGEHHPDFCQPSRKRLIPDLKLIDVNSRKVIEIQVEGSDSQPPVHYLALSYVWGPMTAGSRNTGTGLPDELPNVIEDALIVTQNLGFDYLWVDQYCIDQNDAEAKHVQIQHMGNIYRCAEITIVASNSEGPWHGLCGVSEERALPTQIGSALFVPAHDAVVGEILQSKWNSRGWTYQEFILSRRRLVFTSTQCYFQCNTMSCLEHAPIALDDIHTEDRRTTRKGCEQVFVFPLLEVQEDHSVADTAATNACSQLETYVNDYSARQLSFETDRLNALQGILNDFEDRIQFVRFFQALPLVTDNTIHGETEALALALSWYPKGTGCNQRVPHFPSWSWLGWKQDTSPQRWKREDSGFHFRAIEASFHELQSVKSHDMEASHHALIVVDMISEGTKKPWDSIMKKIMTKSIPRQLDVLLGIHGWTLELDILKNQTDWVNGPFCFNKVDYAEHTPDFEVDVVLGIMIYLQLKAISRFTSDTHSLSPFISQQLRDLDKDSPGKQFTSAEIGVMLIRKSSQRPDAYMRCGWVNVELLSERLISPRRPRAWQGSGDSPDHTFEGIDCARCFQWKEIQLC